MTLLEQLNDTGLAALAPDLRTLSPRAARAWTERMAVRQRPDGTYAVTTESDHTYTVDLRTHTCSCPDHRIRGQQCKHLRRVAIEITGRQLAPPGRQRARCDGCGSIIFVVGIDPPHYCDRCRPSPDDIVVDRETGDSVVVARVTDRRADEYVVEATGQSVAAYDGNERYPETDLVVEATYLGDTVRSDTPRRYAFPLSRLAPTDERLVE